MFTAETNIKQKKMSRLGNRRHYASVQSVTKDGVSTRGDGKRVCFFILEVLEDCPTRTSGDAICPFTLESCSM